MERHRFVAALLEGDERSWARLVDEFGPLIYATGKRLRLGAADRDDLFQATFLKIYRSLGDLRDPERLSAWIMSIAFHEGISFMRRRGPDPGASSGEAELSDDSQEETLQRMARLQDVAVLYDALATLQPRCRDLIRALYLEEPRPSYKVVGRRLGLPVGSIGPIRARCLERLRNAWKTISDESHRTS
ncbi:MAG: sigma-70 family RNA polymerase sigma factor [Candidatus Eisenbacteria bacterium]|nr:sigma-70 family RNA polymerase sigma factor [Candidatus Eisenbacteria bacterium]